MAVTPEEVALASLRRYCNRYLTRATWRETWRGTRYASRGAAPGFILLLRESPLFKVNAVTADGRPLVEDTDYVIDWDRANVWFRESVFAAASVVVEYEAGFDPLPADLQSVIDQVVAIMAAAPVPAAPGVITSIDMPDVGSVRYADMTEMMQGAGLLPAFAPWIGLVNSYRDTSRLWRMPSASRLERIEVPP